jgi:hypothetical protein
MNEDFLNKVKLSKESIDWWMDESVQTAFEAEEIWWLYDMGELTEEELLVKTKELDDRILYLMAKGGFENRNLFETFTKEIENEEKPK